MGAFGEIAHKFEAVEERRRTRAPLLHAFVGGEVEQGVSCAHGQCNSDLFKLLINERFNSFVFHNL